IFEEPGDHAGELETSAVMHFFPELVLPLDQAGPGTSFSYRIQAMREGKVISQRVWGRATADTGVGNPQCSTPEKGQIFVEEATNQIAEVLVELGSISHDAIYEDGKNWFEIERK